MKISIVGIGNGGCNILDDIQKDEYYADAKFVYCDYEADDLSRHGKDHDCKFLLNIEHLNDFSFADENADLTIIASALGGRATSTFSAQITEACKKRSKMVLGAITLPLSIEGQHRIDCAKQTLDTLKPLYDALLIQDNTAIPQNLGIGDMNAPLCSGLKILCTALNEPNVNELNDLSETDVKFIASNGLVIE